MTPPRLVLDTNVLVSALLFPTGLLAWIRGSWQSRAIAPLTSRETRAELVRVLAYPQFQLTGEGRRNVLAMYLPWCETVSCCLRPAPCSGCPGPVRLAFPGVGAVCPSGCSGYGRPRPARSGPGVFSTNPNAERPERPSYRQIRPEFTRLKSVAGTCSRSRC